MGHVIRCQVGSESILLDLDSPDDAAGERNFEKWRADTYATKEPDTLAWIDRCVRAGEVLYDVGANIGQYGLYAGKRLAGRLKVLAFEPEALNYAKLNRNIVLNRLAGVVVPYCLAVTDRTGPDQFYVRTFRPAASLHAMHRPVTQGEQPFEAANIQGMMGASIDDLAGRFALPFPNHIKVDVDGIEERIVAGARATLADARLRSLLIEVYMAGDTADRITRAVVACGMRLANAEQADYTPGVASNLLFVR